MAASQSNEAFTKARVVAFALAVATVGYAIAGTVLILAGIIPEGGLTELPAETAMILKSALLFAGFGSAAASFMIRRMRDADAPAGEAGQQMRFANMIVAMAMVESAGVIGLCVALITADVLFSMILWGVAIAGCILHFPTRTAFGVEA